MRSQPPPTPTFPDVLSCGPECVGTTPRPSFATSGVFSRLNTETPILVLDIATAFSTIHSTVGAPETKESTGIVAFSSPLSLLSVMHTDPSATMSMTSSQSAATLSILGSLMSLASLHDKGLTSATFDVSLSPLAIIMTLVTGSPISTDTISGTVSSSQSLSSFAAAIQTSAPSHDSSLPPLTFLTMETSAAAANAATIFSTPIVTLQLQTPAAPLPSPSPYPSIQIARTFISTSTPHPGLSIPAKSGIAISISLVAIILISVLTFLWRKNCNAERKRCDDLESKAIWVTRSVTVEAEARSNGGGRRRSLRKGKAIPANWTTVPNEAKVVRRWLDVDMIGGLMRWLKARKRVHQLQG